MRFFMSNELLEKEGLIKAFDLKEDEILDARYNLLGFFGTLNKIKNRIESEQVKKEEGQSND